MPSTKKLSRYPAEYFSLVREAVQVPLRVSLRSRDEALRRRRELYAFRDSLRHEASIALDNAYLQLACHRANRLSFLVEGTLLIIGESHRLRGNNFTWKKLEESDASHNPPTTRSTVSAPCS